MRAPAGLVGSHTRRTPETWRNPPPWWSACASPCSRARESSRPVISSFITTLANGRSSPTSRRVRGPAGSVRLPRIAPPLMRATSLWSRSRIASATKSPRFVSPLVSPPERASRSAAVRPTTTSRSPSSPRASRPGTRRRLAARDARVAEDDVGARARHPRRLGRRQPEETDADAVEGQQEVGRRIAEGAPGGPVHHVGREPHEPRLGDALAQHAGAEVELVVAEGREVEADRVQRGDHLRAAQDPGLAGWRGRAAREDEQGVRVLPPRLADERGEPRHSPPVPAVHGSEDVDVVDLEQRDPDEAGVAGAEGRAGGEEGRREDHEERAPAGGRRTPRRPPPGSGR